MTSAAAPRVLVFPRSPNPYQQDLYDAMSTSHPVVVRYVDGPTPSQTVNLLALPLLLAAGRLRGFRILHVHWVYPFGLSWANGRWTRGLIRRWYSVVLALASALGLRIVWTAHNLLPHEPVFVDDVAARRELIGRCAAVIAHDDSAAAVVRGWGAHHVAVVPSGVRPGTARSASARAAACDRLGLDREPVRALFFGNIRHYKGVDLLLEAMAQLDPLVPMHLAVVGRCGDQAARARLQSMADVMPSPERVRARFDFVPDDELASYLAASDFAVFPFRAVTNSSSVLHALASGLPVIIPDLPPLADVPPEAALRFVLADDRTSLVAALARAARLSGREWEVMAGAAARFAESRTWSDAASATWTIYAGMLAGAATTAVAVPERFVIEGAP